MAKKKKKIEEYSEPVTNCDQLVKVDANCNHPEKGEIIPR